MINIDYEVDELLAIWIQKQTKLLKKIINGATDATQTLTDALCDFNNDRNLDLIYMTTESEEPFVVRPYIWDIIRLF